jgi:hypothetical protein
MAGKRQFSLCARGMEPGGIPSHPASKPGIPNRATPLPELCRSFNHQASQSWLFQGTGAIQGALNGFPRLHAAVVHTHPSALALPNPFIFAGDPATALEVINPYVSGITHCFALFDKITECSSATSPCFIPSFQTDEVMLQLAFHFMCF